MDMRNLTCRQFLTLAVFVGSLGLSLFAAPVRATTIDFNSLASAQCLTTSSNFALGGYQFHRSNSDQLKACGPAGPQTSNGSVTLGFVNYPDPLGTLSISLVGGGTFDFFSIDLAPYFILSDSRSALNAAAVNIVGTTASNTTVSMQITLNASGFATYSNPAQFASFVDLTSIVLSSGGGGSGYFLLDNVVVVADAPAPTGVPEPASLALLGLGLLGMSILRKRKN